MPLTPGQPDGIDHTSIAYEDKLLLKLRIERLGSPRAYSQQPPSRCTHVLQQPEIESCDAQVGTWVTRSAFVYVEARAEDQFMLAERWCATPGSGAMGACRSCASGWT